jgi:tetratricopeptide (TPR) repeat protein
MKSIPSFQRKLAKVYRCWENDELDAALQLVEQMKEEWPGNAQLHVLWASLVQLQDEPTHSLDDVKHVLQQAIILEKDSPIGPIELGYYHDSVEDNPEEAKKAFSDAIRLSRRLLIDALLGQTKALIQLDQKDEALKCLMQVLALDVGDLSGRIVAIQMKHSLPDQIMDLLRELVSKRPA